MSFRGRLRVFFTIIVIVPMIALAVVLLRLAAQSETGKADAGISTGVNTAYVVYQDAEREGTQALRRIAADRQLRRAVARGDRDAIEARSAELAAADSSVKGVTLTGPGGTVIAKTGEGVAPARLQLLQPGGGSLGTLSVSVTSPEEYVRDVSRLTGLETAVLSGAQPLASSVPGLEQPPPVGSEEFKIDGEEYRGRRQPIRSPYELVVFQNAEDVNSSIAENRLLILGILLAFLILAVASSLFVVRALQGQIGEFLDAARRLAKGDFEHPVPTHGQDEFAALGNEFNTMSDQLAAYIDEVERKRRELEDTIRRIGEAFASGLDRQGVVELMVRTAVDACSADAGRALPLDVHALAAVHTGSEDEDVQTALQLVERKIFEVRPEAGAALLETGELPADTRRMYEVSVDSVHAIGIPMRAYLGARSYAQYVGVVSIARRGLGFSQSEKDLLEYLTGQAVVSIENADLHETVQRQAVTDELTGLSNVRSLHSALDREIERSRRFNSPLGLVMLDIDDFKKVNDEFGHQQGDEVLTAVAHVLREHSRDIDVPARYGGEELAVVVPQTDSGGAVQLAERMREAIERLQIARFDHGAPLTITASFGVAEIPASARDKSTLIAAADAALYRAKRAGKNRVERADPVTAGRS
jgi:diguanylate cyclase (GGDEF)-like protein